MPEDQDNQIERRDSGGINRRSETARRGRDAARFVGGLVNKPSDVTRPHGNVPDHTYDFVLKWGSKGTGDGEFSGLISTAEGAKFSPTGLAVALDGSVYVADLGNSRIQKFTSDGLFVTEWGTWGSGDAEFLRPYDVAVGYDGSVYVSDEYLCRINKFTSDGVFLTKWGIPSSESIEGEWEFDYPQGVAVGYDGRVYVSDAYVDCIQVFTSDGMFLDEFCDKGQFWPNGLAVAPDGSVYVSSWNRYRIL